MNRAAKVAVALALTGGCVCAHGPECHQTALLKRVSGAVSVSAAIRDYGVLGDGSDETARIQAEVASAATAGKALYWNAGNYVVSAAIPIFADTKFVTDCATCVSITNSNNAPWTLEYNSPVGAASYPQRVGIEIDGLTINAKFGIKINQPFDLYGATAAFDNQGLVLGLRIANFIFNGTYATAYNSTAQTYACPLDPECGSNTVPALGELKAFGVGISLSGVFDSEVSQFQIQHAGIGIYLDHSDLNSIRHGCLNLNARHIHATGGRAAGTFLGSQDTIQDNDILANLRAGGITLEGTHFYRLINNYFEETGTAQASDTFLSTSNDQGTVFETNRFDSTFPSTAPLFVLNPSFGQQWRNNSWNPRGDSVPLITVLHDHWSAFWPMPIDWRSNQLDFPAPDDPGVLLSDPKPFLMAPNNAFNLGGGISAGFPWKKNEMGKWVLVSGPRVAVFTAALQDASAHVYTFRFTGRGKDASGGSFGITYLEPGTGDGSFLIVAGGTSLGITDPANPQTVELTYSLPAGAPGTGAFQISVDNATVEVAKIELVAVDAKLKPPACTI
jgi:hypothetical protein